MTTRVDMSPQDALWLDVERPSAVMVVDAVLWLDGRLDTDALLEVLQTRLVDRYPAFRRVAVPGSHPVWRDDPAFDLRRHLVQATLPDPGGEAALQAYVGEVRGHPLDRSRPLWEVHLLEGPTTSAVVFRIHHAIADGIRVSQVVMSLCDDRRGRPLIPPPPADEGDLASGLRAGVRSVAQGVREVAEEVPEVATEVADRVTMAASTMAERVQQAVADPTRAVLGAVDQARTAMGSAGAAWRDLWSDAADLAVLSPARLAESISSVRANATALSRLFLGEAPTTIWSGEVGAAKSVGWSAPVPLRDIREVALRTGTSVADVLVSAVAGAVRRYTVEHGAPVTTVTFFLPVNVRPFGAVLPRELGSLFALLPLTLAANVDDPLDRLADVHGRLLAVAKGPTSTVAFGLANVGPYLPGGAARLFLERGADRSAGILANIPGPRAKAFLAGVGVAGVMGFAPTAGNQPLAVTLFTYEGKVRVGVAADTGLVHRPQKIVDYVTDELDRLRVATDAAETSATD